MTYSCGQLLTTLSRAFRDGRLDVIAAHFSYPMPFYAHDGIVVFGSQDTLIEALAFYRAATAKAGIVEIVPRIVAQGIVVRGYSNVWVEWDHMDQAGICQRTSQVRYVIFEDRFALFPKIEMVDYTVTAFPEVQQHLPFHATA